jgi:hypothetical protein
VGREGLVGVVDDDPDVERAEAPVPVLEPDDVLPAVVCIGRIVVGELEVEVVFARVVDVVVLHVQAHIDDLAVGDGDDVPVLDVA